MDYETLTLNLENAERVASRALANVQAHRGLILRMKVLGINSRRIRETLFVLEQTHGICLAEVIRLRAALASMPLN